METFNVRTYNDLDFTSGSAATTFNEVVGKTNAGFDPHHNGLTIAHVKFGYLLETPKAFWYTVIDRQLHCENSEDIWTISSED